MYCLNEPSEVDFLANKEGFEKFSQLSIILNRCNGQSHCKSESEINNFIASHIIRVMYNQKTYISTNYGDEEIVQGRIASQRNVLNQSSSSAVRYEIQK